MRTYLLTVALAATAALGGCGGGGSGDRAAASFNLLAGYTSLVKNGEVASVTLSGNAIAGGVTTPFTGTGTLTLAPSTADTFNGTASISQSVDVSASITGSGQPATYGSSVVNHYSSGTLTFLGQESATEYDVARTAFNYPTTLADTCTGTLGVLDRYTDNTMSVSLGTIQLTYACTAPASTGGPLAVKFTSKLYDAQGALAETDVTSYSLTSTNAMTFVSATTQNSLGNLSITAP